VLLPGSSHLQAQEALFLDRVLPSRTSRSYPMGGEASGPHTGLEAQGPWEHVDLPRLSPMIWAWSLGTVHLHPSSPAPSLFPPLLTFLLVPQNLEHQT
jgi:hypothetical protein